MPDPYNPQSLNRYAYCLNNPLIYTDPSGYIYQDDNDEWWLDEITVTEDKWQQPSVFAYSTMGFAEIDFGWSLADSISGGVSPANNEPAATSTANQANNNEVTKDTTELGLVETVKKNFMGIRYPKGKEEKKIGIGRNEKGEIIFIDCSHLVYEAHKALNVSYNYSSTADFANNPHYRPLKEGETPKKDDVMLFPGHMGFYDPNPPISGYSLLGATSSGGVRYGAPSWFSGEPIYYRYVP